MHDLVHAQTHARLGNARGQRHFDNTHRPGRDRGPVGAATLHRTALLFGLQSGQDLRRRQFHHRRGIRCVETQQGVGRQRVNLKTEPNTFGIARVHGQRAHLPAVGQGAPVPVRTFASGQCRDLRRQLAPNTCAHPSLLHAIVEFAALVRHAGQLRSRQHTELNDARLRRLLKLTGLHGRLPCRPGRSNRV
ncbi:hypothetical protein D9M68_673190 [compost metagenome]